MEQTGLCRAALGCHDPSSPEGPHISMGFHRPPFRPRDAFYCPIVALLMVFTVLLFPHSIGFTVLLRPLLMVSAVLPSAQLMGFYSPLSTPVDGFLLSAQKDGFSCPSIPPTRLVSTVRLSAQFDCFYSPISTPIDGFHCPSFRPNYGFCCPPFIPMNGFHCPTFS